MKTAIKDIDEMVSGLLEINHKTNSILVMEKIKKALANIKRAKTLLEKSEQTLIWARYYVRSSLNK